MSDPALPEDLARWPQDPFRLLGVARGVSARDLRRAYTRLIRQYKPEQFPNHFRRIREAYETVRRLLDWMEWDQAQADAEPEPQRETTPVGENPNDGRVSENDKSSTAARAPNLEDEMHHFWELAVAGQELEAYRNFSEASLRNANDPEILLRLYWLLTLNPDLDPQRHRCDWLVQGLQNRGLIGKLRELYRQELAQNPVEAVSDRCTRLLQRLTQSSQLAELAEWRWPALFQLGRWDLWAGDLESLCPRIITDEEETWVRLVFSAVDWLAWAPDEMAQDLLDSCRREIHQHEHLAARMPHFFDRLDFLMGITPGWRVLQKEGNAPPSLVRLMPLSWNQSIYELKPRILLLLEEICQDPQVWLWYFDEVQRHAPGALAHFGALLTQLDDHAEESPAEFYSDAIAKLGQDFLDSQGTISYPDLRLELLEFCLREAVAPEKLAASVGDRPAHWPPRGISFSQKVTEDYPLRYLFQAHYIFWRS